LTLYFHEELSPNDECISFGQLVEILCFCENVAIQRKKCGSIKIIDVNMCLAIPGKLVSVEDSTDVLFKSGKVSFEGNNQGVNLAAVPEAKVGQYVLVHVGMALKRHLMRKRH
jgi:hydrogenase assembly chaperone HypC/HupF